MLKQTYRGFKSVGGDDAAKYVKLPKVPEGKEVKLDIISATIFTTTPGDYTTTKFIYVGYLLHENFHIFEGHDVQPGSGRNPGVVSAKNITVPPGGEPCAYFEATATTTKYVVSASGTLRDIQTGNSAKKEE